MFFYRDFIPFSYDFCAQDDYTKYPSILFLNTSLIDVTCVQSKGSILILF